MPDISMCSGKECPLRFSCYRCNAKPNDARQSYFTKPPFKVDGDVIECEHWLKITGADKKELLKKA